MYSAEDNAVTILMTISICSYIYGPSNGNHRGLQQ